LAGKPERKRTKEVGIEVDREQPADKKGRNSQDGKREGSLKEDVTRKNVPAIYWVCGTGKKKKKKRDSIEKMEVPSSRGG